MKRLFFIFSIFAMLLTSCETISEDNNQSIRLTSKDVVSVGCGSSMGYISYDILVPVEGATVEATSTVEWIGNFDYKQMGKIMYNVEKNPSEQEREGEIVVSYDNTSFKVLIKQAGNPKPTSKTITDFQLTGKYYGIQSGMYNYYLIFSDLGLDSNNMFSVPNGRYYLVDLFLTEAPADASNVTVPVGTYDFDKTSSGFANTFTDTYSWYQINDEYGNASSKNQISYEKGTLTVEEGKVTLDVTLYIDGIEEIHTVVYEGDYSMINEAA